MKLYKFIMLTFFASFQVSLYNISLGNETIAKPTLSIELFKNNLIPGEPILVTIKAKNNSQESIVNSFLNNKDFEKTAEFTFSIENNASTKIFEILMYVNVMPDSFVLSLKKPKLLPGELFTCGKIFLPWLDIKNGKPFSFNNKAPDKIILLPTGSYKLTAKLRWLPIDMENYHIVSEPVDFIVKEPSGIDARAVKLFKTGDIVGFYDGYWGSEPESITKLLKDYPQSTYAKYAKLRLVIDQASTINNSGSIDIPAKKIESLISDGLDIVQKFKDIPINDDVLLACADMAEAIGNEEETIKIIDQLIKDYPQSNSAEIAQKRLPPNYVLPPNQKKILEQNDNTPTNFPFGIVLSIAGAAVAVIAIAGVIFLIRKKKLNKSE